MQTLSDIQRDAAEAAVARNLAAKGLIDLCQAAAPSLAGEFDPCDPQALQALDGATIDARQREQIAQVITDTEKAGIAGTESAQSAIETVASFTHIYRPPQQHAAHQSAVRFRFYGDTYATATTVLTIGLGRATFTQAFTADELEHIARAYLDAAHHLRQQAKTL